MKLLLRNHLCPGDIVVLTAAVRDLHRAHPGVYRTAVDTSCMPLWENNPFVTPLSELGRPDRTIDCDCPAVNLSNRRPAHFVEGAVEDLERQLGVPIPAGPIAGDIYLSPEEAALPSPAAEAGHEGSYWVVMAGGKHDLTTKWWDPQFYQEVVDHFAGRMAFVQCGARGDWHPPLRGVVSLVGRTDLRQFIRLVYHADGVLCPITFAMHLAAAVPPRPGEPAPRPCVVVAGGREPPQWEAYPGHRFLHTVGELDCCATGGCWRSRCQPAGDHPPDRVPGDVCLRPVTLHDRLRIGQCMAMITPARVIEAVESYYDRGVLKYGADSAPPRMIPRPTTPAVADQISPVAVQRRRPGVAVTIGVGRDAELARLAAAEVRARTGLDTVILGDVEFAASGVEHPHYLKFRLFDLVDADNLLFFDADVVCLEEWDPGAFFGRPEVVAVRDRMIDLVIGEAEEWDVPVEDYFNSGVMVLSRRHHHALLRRAETLVGSRRTSLFEQSPLNAARVQLGVPLKLLDRRFNWVWFGDSSLSHQMPVVMAHKLLPDRPDVNVRYYNGAYELPAPTININEREGRRLAGRSLAYFPDGHTRSVLRLRDDGTVTPHAGGESPGYWFVQDIKGTPTLTLTSIGRVLHRLTQTRDGFWKSTTPGDPARCVDESVYEEEAVTEANARSVADRFLRSLAPCGPGGGGRGIVICGGDRQFASAWVCVRMLRHLGCELPIDLWQLSASELGRRPRELLRPFSVRCVDAAEVRERHPVRQLGGWELKPYAILHSGFDQVLYLDADNVPVRDPSYLFESEPFHSRRAVFWPDAERLGPDDPVWRICGVDYRDEPEFETGQLVVDKRLCREPLQLTVHLNAHSDFYYRYVHGDKETFHMAWRMMGREYAMVPSPLHALPFAMCQHDFEGRRLFQHRNRAKWATGRANRRIKGFEFEDECLAFLSELERRLEAPLPAESVTVAR
jgi:ADP-heptose:LPS heptosyltransferase